MVSDGAKKKTAARSGGKSGTEFHLTCTVLVNGAPAGGDDEGGEDGGGDDEEEEEEEDEDGKL